MAGRDIRAGRAFVEIYTKNSGLIKGLNQAQRKLKDFGNGMAAVGRWTMGLGASITAPFIAAVKVFENTGSALLDMSKRTGFSTMALSELGYAAQQTGADMNAVEKGIRKMQKTIGDAHRGLSTAQDALQSLGISLSELDAMSPEDQFMRITEALGQIENPTRRAAAAMDIFGRAGTALLPMLGDMKALRAEAIALGMSISTDDAEAADAFGDAMTRTGVAVKAVFFQIGAAVANSGFLDAITNIVKSVQKWAKENRPLIAMIATIGAGITAAGIALVVLGTAISGIGSLLGAAATGLTFISGIVSAILSPLGLAVAGVVALGAGLLYLARNTTAMKSIHTMIGSVVESIRGTWNTLVSDVKTAWSGVVDAISAGRLDLAMKVVTAAIRLEWTRLKGFFTEWFDSYLGSWELLTINISKLFSKLEQSIIDVWGRLQYFAMQQAAPKLTQLAYSRYAGGDRNPDMTPSDVAAAANWNPNVRDELTQAYNHNDVGDWGFDAEGRAGAMMAGLSEEAKEAVRGARRRRLAAWKTFDESGGRIIDDVVREEHDAMISREKKRAKKGELTRAKLDADLMREQQKNGVGKGNGKEIIAAEEALRQAAKEAAQAAADVANEREKRAKDRAAAGFPGAAMGEASKAFGTFSGSALSGIGGGGIVGKLVRVNEKANDILVKIEHWQDKNYVEMRRLKLEAAP